MGTFDGDSTSVAVLPKPSCGGEGKPGPGGPAGRAGRMVTFSIVGRTVSVEGIHPAEDRRHTPRGGQNAHAQKTAKARRPRGRRWGEQTSGGEHKSRFIGGPQGRGSKTYPRKEKKQIKTTRIQSRRGICPTKAKQGTQTQN